MYRNQQSLAITGISKLAAVAAALLALTALTVSRSDAAFSASTANSANSFTAGSVVLTDDDSGTAMFAATGMTPGTPVIECLELTYAGSLTPADVRMYATTTGTLKTYLNTTIEVGTGGDFSDCTGFTPTSTIYSGTLANFETTHTDWTSGLAVFTAAANPTVRVLRFSVELANNQAAQGLSSTAEFTFEAQD